MRSDHQGVRDLQVNAVQIQRIAATAETKMSILPVRVQNPCRFGGSHQHLRTCDHEVPVRVMQSNIQEKRLLQAYFREASGHA